MEQAERTYCLTAYVLSHSCVLILVFLPFFNFCEEFIKYSQCLRELNSSHITSKTLSVAIFIATVFQTSFHSYCVNVIISSLRIKVVLSVSSGALLTAIEPEVKMFPQPPYCYFKFHSKVYLKKLACVPRCITRHDFGALDKWPGVVRHVITDFITWENVTAWCYPVVQFSY